LLFVERTEEDTEQRLPSTVRKLLNQRRLKHLVLRRRQIGAKP
jgi:hypothetical protein